MNTRLTLATLFASALPVAGQGFNEPPTALDIDPSPTVVEINLDASVQNWQYMDGIDTVAWTYNGTVPGPTIRANLGDTIRVHFTNNLPEETTVHWHGIEAPAHVDGSHIAQNPIQPGETYTYEWTALNDGLHWYHPHIRTHDQVEKGLYGAILITNPQREASLGLDQIEEHILFFDDILLDANSQVVPAFSFTDPLQNAVYQLNGREGNLLLVNGKEASQATLSVPNGEPQRWRVVNAANTTFCRLDLRDPLTGIDQSLWQIGSDGGFIDKPFRLYDMQSTAPGPDHPGQALLNQMGQGIMLMPGERIDVVFTPIGNAGETFTIQQKDWFRGRHTAMYNGMGMIMMGEDPLDGYYPDQDYLKLQLQGPDPGLGEHVLPAQLRNFPSWVVPPKGKLPIMMGHGMPDMMGNVPFFVQMKMMNGAMSGLPGMMVTSDDAMDVQVGDVWQWEVVNMTHGEHPFHTHGFAFELMEYEFQDDLDPALNFKFVPSQKRMYKDTIRIPPRLGGKGTSRTIARLRVHFKDDGREGEVAAMGEMATVDPQGNWTSGGWLAHCHILEHAGRGMGTFFEVHEPDEVFTLHGRFMAGAAGHASLTATGDVPNEGNVTVSVVNAVPGALVYLAAGNIAAKRTLVGGTFVPGYSSTGTAPQPGDPLFAKVFKAVADANGVATFNVGGWQFAPAGMELYFQAAFADVGGPQGWAFSNALSFTRP